MRDAELKVFNIIEKNRRYLKHEPEKSHFDPDTLKNSDSKMIVRTLKIHNYSNM